MSSAQNFTFASQLGFEIAQPESVENIKGEQGLEQKTFDGVAVVLIHMIGMPVRDQFIEGTIVDIPTLVSYGCPVKELHGTGPDFI
jgi:hypothetical protein